MRACPKDPNNRLFLGHFVEQASVGQPFPRSNWPLHITLVPWFLCSSSDKLDEELEGILASLKPFEVTVGEPAMFGSKKNIRVNLIEPSSQLQKLHKLLVDLVHKLGKIDTDERFTGDGYRPHITHVAGRNAKPGERILVDSLHLTELIDNSHCKPLKHYEMAYEKAA